LRAGFAPPPLFFCMPDGGTSIPLFFSGAWTTPRGPTGLFSRSTPGLIGNLLFSLPRGHFIWGGHGPSVTTDGDYLFPPFSFSPPPENLIPFFFFSGERHAPRRRHRGVFFSVQATFCGGIPLGKGLFSPPFKERLNGAFFLTPERWRAPLNGEGFFFFFFFFFFFPPQQRTCGCSPSSFRLLMVLEGGERRMMTPPSLSL